MPILAVVDANGNGLPDVGEPGNVTIDRLYTGFLQVIKRARIMAADGVTRDPGLQRRAVHRQHSAGPLY